MKIKYEKRRIRNNLASGILLLGIGLFAIIYDRLSMFSFFWFLFGAVQIGTALYEKKYQYLTIDNNKLIKHSLIPRTIVINDIQKVLKFRNSYKIETPRRTITIDKGIIETESLSELADYFNNLQLKNFGVRTGQQESS